MYYSSALGSWSAASSVRGSATTGCSREDARPTFGAQGWEYLDLGRFWQVLLIVGMLLWMSSCSAASGTAGDRQSGTCLTCSSYSAFNPALLRVGLACTRSHVRDRRLLAVLGRPPVGRGLPGTVHHDPRRVHLRAARSGVGEDRPAGDLLRRHPVLGRRGGRHDAPLLLQRRAGRAHGPRGIFLRGGSHPADLPDGRGVDIPAHGGATGVAAGANSRTGGRSCSSSPSGSGTSSGPACSGS